MDRGWRPTRAGTRSGRRSGDYYFRYRISPDDCVLDLGAGYGDFINNVVARRRIAVDVWAGLPSQVAKEVEVVVGPVTRPEPPLPTVAVDFAFACNLFRARPQQDVFVAALASLRTHARAGGYAHDPAAQLPLCLSGIFRRLYPCRGLFAHQSRRSPAPPRLGSRRSPAALSSADGEVPLADMARSSAYLGSPIKPLGKQMLVRARPVRR